MTPKLFHVSRQSQKIHTPQPIIFWVQSTRLVDSFESLNSSLAQSVQELGHWCWTMLIEHWCWIMLIIPQKHWFVSSCYHQNQFWNKLLAQLFSNHNFFFYITHAFFLKMAWCYC